MRTPEEIKGGLAECSAPDDGKAHCSMCPYYADGNGVVCIRAMTGEALSYIKQLEMLAKPNEQIRWERDVAIDQLRQLGIGFGEKVEAQLPKWISVEERLPQSLAEVLICDDKGRMVVGHYDEDDGRFWECVNTDTFHSVNATHWMPLPEPPKEG